MLRGRRLALEPLEARDLLAVTLFSEGFEGVFPAADWSVGNLNSTTVSEWGDNCAKAYAGGWSAFCADNGDSMRQTYDHNLDTYLDRANVDVAGYDYVTLTFKYWINTESVRDYLKIVTYRTSPPVYNNHLFLDGSSGGWQTATVSLPPFRGTLRFEFISDGSTIPSAPAGVWVDDVTLTAGFRQDDLAVDLGSAALWAYMNDSGWTRLHSRNPKWVAPSYLFDGNLLVDFGAPHGIYAYKQTSNAWTLFHRSTADAAIRRWCDFSPETVVDFGTTYGLYCYAEYYSTWYQIHSLSPESMFAADLDGGAEEVICDFGAHGIWVWSRPSPYDSWSWRQLHSRNPVSMVSAQLDGNELSDLVVDFGPGTGLWAYSNDATWSKLHASSARSMAAADLNGDGRTELIVDFGAPHGIYEYSPASGLWRRLHGASCDALAPADVDASGQTDLVVDFGASGAWLWMNDAYWRFLHPHNPDAILGIDLDLNDTSKAGAMALALDGKPSAAEVPRDAGGVARALADPRREPAASDPPKDVAAAHEQRPLLAPADEPLEGAAQAPAAAADSGHWPFRAARHDRALAELEVSPSALRGDLGGLESDIAVSLEAGPARARESAR